MPAERRAGAVSGRLLRVLEEPRLDAVEGHHEDQLAELPFDLCRLAVHDRLATRPPLRRRPFEDDANRRTDHGLELARVLRLGRALDVLAVGSIAIHVEEHEAVLAHELRRDVLTEAHEVSPPRVLPPIGLYDRPRLGGDGLPGLGVLSRHRTRRDAAQEPDDEHPQSIVAPVLRQQQHRQPRTRRAHHRPRVMRMSPTCSIPTS